MRIVAGIYGGRALNPPATNNIRPTTDRVRESLFSILASRYPELLKNGRVIDLFAGTGALGLEALSRGAQFAMFVEASREGQALIRKNIDDLQLKKQTALMGADAAKMGAIGKTKPFDIAFADPPYGKGLAEKAMMNLVNNGWLAPNALVVIEDKVNSHPPFLPSFTLMLERKFGDTMIRFMKPG